MAMEQPRAGLRCASLSSFETTGSFVLTNSPKEGSLGGKPDESAQTIANIRALRVMHGDGERWGDEQAHRAGSLRRSGDTALRGPRRGRRAMRGPGGFVEGLGGWCLSRV